MKEWIDCLDRQFAEIHRCSRELIYTVPVKLLYRKPISRSLSLLSGGEQVLRSAAIVEQTFGGITANLWDDPFEWTLPENLSTPKKITDYLNEVEDTRKAAFELFISNEDLQKEIMAPSGVTSLLSLLLDTLVQAVHHQSIARTIFELEKTENIE